MTVCKIVEMEFVILECTHLAGMKVGSGEITRRTLEMTVVLISILIMVIVVIG